MSLLFTPLEIKSVTFRNRIIVSPMCEYSSTDGFANNWHLVHLGSRGVGGAGLVITEATGVSPEGRISADDLGIWKDEHIPFLQNIVQFIHEQGAVAGMQLSHAGRKASTTPPWKGIKQVKPEEGGWQPVAPSAIAYKPEEIEPLELDEEGIKKVISDFAVAAVRAKKAGFKVIEIHAAHGYLIHQFLSPLSNVRTDEYGGSFENRSRLVLQVIDAIQKVWPKENPLFVRISATDYADGGWDIEQSVKLSKILKEKNVDLIDVSSGGLVFNARIQTGPGYQVPFAERIKKETGILTGAVGMITNALQAEEILKSAQADMIIMARELLRQPYFPLHAANELGDDISWPVQYLRAKPTK